MPYCPQALTECVWYGECPTDCVYLHHPIPEIDLFELLDEVTNPTPEPPPITPTISIPFLVALGGQTWNEWSMQAVHIPEGLSLLLISALDSIFPRATNHTNSDFAESCIGCGSCPHYPKSLPHYEGASFQASLGSPGTMTILFSCGARSRHTPCLNPSAFCLDIPEPLNRSLIPRHLAHDPSHDEPSWLNMLGTLFAKMFLPNFGDEY